MTILPIGRTAGVLTVGSNNPALKMGTKIEYWKKWHFFELLHHLHKCDDILERTAGGREFDNTDIGNIHANLIDIIDDIEFGNVNQLHRVHEFINQNDSALVSISKIDHQLIDKIKAITENWIKNAIH